MNQREIELTIIALKFLQGEYEDLAVIRQHLEGERNEWMGKAEECRNLIAKLSMVTA